MSKRSNEEKYGPLLESYKPTFSSIFKKILIDKFLVEKEEKKTLYREDVFKKPESPHIAEGELEYIAIVYDGEVKEMIRIMRHTAKYLLGESELVGYDPKLTEVKPGMLYVDGAFIEKPADEKED